MTKEQFIKDVQDYYRNKYNPTQGKYIFGWLQKQEDKGYNLGLVIAELVKSFSATSTNPLPVVYDLEVAFKEMKQNRMRPELQQAKTLQIEEDTVMGEKGAEMMQDILKDLVEKKKVKEGENE